MCGHGLIALDKHDRFYISVLDAQGRTTMERLDFYLADAHKPQRLLDEIVFDIDPRPEELAGCERNPRVVFELFPGTRTVKAWYFEEYWLTIFKKEQKPKPTRRPIPVRRLSLAA